MVESKHTTPKSEFQVITASEEHFATIKELNDAVVELTSPMDLDRVKKLDELSAYHQVAVRTDGTVVAFIICFGPGVDYKKSGNHAWFNSRY